MKVKSDHRSKFSNLSNWKEEGWKKTRASMRFEPVTSPIPVRCSTNWAMKPHIGSEVNLLSSYLPRGMKYIWNNSYFNVTISYILHIMSLLKGDYELDKLTSLPMCGFIAQLVQHCNGIAGVTGSNPLEALIFFRLLLSNCLNWRIYFDDYSSLSSTTAVQIWIISYKNFKIRHYNDSQAHMIFVFLK